MTKVYGNGNDTVIIDHDDETVAEIECYKTDVQIYFSDGTRISYRCNSTEQCEDIWRVSVDQEGTAEYDISADDDEFGDVFEINAEAVIWVYAE